MIKYRINYNLLIPFLFSALLFSFNGKQKGEFPKCTWSLDSTKSIKSIAEITYDIGELNDDKSSFFGQQPRSTTITAYDLNSNPIAKELYLNGSKKLHQRTTFNYANDVLISKDLEMLYSNKKSNIKIEYSKNLVISHEKRGNFVTTIYSNYDNCSLVKSQMITSFGNEKPDTMSIIPVFEDTNTRPIEMYILNNEKKDTILFQYGDFDETGEWQKLIKTFKRTNTKEAIIRQFQYY